MKRKSRRELIDKIKSLQHDVKLAYFDRDDWMRRAHDAEKRIMALGAMDKYEHFKGIQAIQIKPIRYGKYMKLTRESDILELIEPVKRRIIESLASGLIEQGMVQIIVKEDDDPVFGGTTIAAKLYVVPWDKTVMGVKCSTWA